MAGAIRSCRVDHRSDETTRYRSFFRNRATELEFVDDPARPGPGSRQPQIEIVERLLEFRVIKDSGARRENLNGIETKLFGLPTAADKIIPKDEGTAASFFHQADRDAGSYHIQIGMVSSGEHLSTATDSRKVAGPPSGSLAHDLEC